MCVCVCVCVWGGGGVIGLSDLNINGHTFDSEKLT